MAEIGQAFGEVARSGKITTASQPIAKGGGLAERTTGQALNTLTRRMPPPRPSTNAPRNIDR